MKIKHSSAYSGRSFQVLYYTISFLIIQLRIIPVMSISNLMYLHQLFVEGAHSVNLKVSLS